MPRPVEAVTALLLLAGWGVADGPFANAQAVSWHHFQTEYNVAIEGFDPVAYFTVGEARIGSPAHEARHGGLIYHFASAEHREAFVSDPGRYLPACGGWDVLMCAVDRDPATGSAPTRWPSTPTEFRIHGGRLLLFSVNPWGRTREMVQEDSLDALVRDADRFWAGRDSLAAVIGPLPTGMHPRAIMEHGLWAPLLGRWQCQGRILVNLQARTYRNLPWAHWEFGFGFGGYAVEDAWLPPNRNTSGPALRYWDPVNARWVMMFVPLASPPSNIWMMDGWHDAAGFHGEFEGTGAGGRPFRQRIHFTEITDRSFYWHAERSFDEGATWIDTFQDARCSR